MALREVPITMFGVPVGSASINDDGTLALNIDSSCDLSKDVMRYLEDGEYTGLSLMPIGVPTPPEPAK